MSLQKETHIFMRKRYPSQKWFSDVKGEPPMSLFIYCQIVHMLEYNVLNFDAMPKYADLKRACVVRWQTTGCSLSVDVEFCLENFLLRRHFTDVKPKPFFVVMAEVR